LRRIGKAQEKKREEGGKTKLSREKAGEKKSKKRKVKGVNRDRFFKEKKKDAPSGGKGAEKRDVSGGLPPIGKKRGRKGKNSNEKVRGDFKRSQRKSKNRRCLLFGRPWIKKGFRKKGPRRGRFLRLERKRKKDVDGS